MAGTLLLATDLGLTPTGKRRFSVGGQRVSVDVEAVADTVVGDYPDLLRERQHHRDLWAWCERQGVRPPAQFRPS